MRSSEQRSADKKKAAGQQQKNVGENHYKCETRGGDTVGGQLQYDEQVDDTLIGRNRVKEADCKGHSRNKGGREERAGCNKR